MRAGAVGPGADALRPLVASELLAPRRAFKEANVDLIMLVLVLAIVGFVVWLITTRIPMPPIFQTVIYIVVLIVLVLWLLRRFGGSIPNVM